jgi:putative nucleotidyltransferase with HDIG domain
VLGLSRLSIATQRLLLGLFAFGFVVLGGVTVLTPQPVDWIRLLFWTGVALVAAALPVRLPGGMVAHVTTAPILAALFDPALPNPFSVCWVAFVGTFEPRDFRRQLPWYGTLNNRFNYLLPAFAAWSVKTLTDHLGSAGDPAFVIAQLVLVGSTFMFVNAGLAVLVVSVRDGAPISRVFAVSVQSITVALISQVPLGWLMAEVANKVGYWATLLFMVPLLLARYSFAKYTELRELFYGSVSALSQAIDAKDGFTRGHADRVSRIAGALAREMHLSEHDIEQIELAALLHDIGKIGVEDRILLKPERLDPAEKERMQQHPIFGASILEPSVALRPLVPLVLHHHENYDGSGYPDGLSGEAIPLGSRIIIVADAYEAMTSDRVYRKAPGHERAMDQLTKYQGIQFDPAAVRALKQLLQRRGTQAFEVSDLPPINYETLAELRKRLAQAAIVSDAHAG